MQCVLNQFILIILCTAGSIAVWGQNNRAPQIAHPDLIQTERRNDNRPSKLDPVFDKEKNETTFFLSGLMVIDETPFREVRVPGETQNRMIPSSILKMVVYYKTPGKKKTKPEDVIIAFNYGSASGYEFLNHRDISITANGEKFELGRMNLVEKKDEGFRAFGFIRYWETLEISVKTDVYRKIFDSKSVSIQIGGQSVRLTNDHLKNLQSYFKELK